jgi:hypothetical protein
MTPVTVFSSLVTTALAVAALATPAAQAAQAGSPAAVSEPAAAVAPPSGASIEVATVNGSGCPAGTTFIQIAPGNTAFSVNFLAYRAVTGPEAGSTEFRRNCQISLRVNYPPEYTYALATAQYRGALQLAAGARGLHRSTYYIQGTSASTQISHTRAGPLSGAWSTNDTIDPTARIWAPCGAQRNLNINTELRVYRGTSAETETSWLSLLSAATDLNHLAWRTCE